MYVWMEPVFSSANSPKPIIPYQTARVIFFGIASLHSHASQFYREMDFVLGSFERSQNASDGIIDDGMRIGALFRTNDRHWGEFIAYVRNYGTAVNCLKQLQDYKPYQRYHEECMLQKRTNRQSLKDLLMLPIQRITRYTLLLKNVLKHTPAMHSDHIDLCRAVKNVTHFASIVNECRRKQEEMHRLIEIFRTVERCPPLPPSDTRTYISEFIVRELISRQPTRLLLFSDMVIVTQAPPQTKLDAEGQIESVVAEWTYYGMAQLDQAEIQNADESTNTLVTILSLNRNASTSVTAGSVDSSGTAPSLPSGSESQAVPTNTSGSRVFNSASSQNSISDAGEGSELQSRVSGSNPLHGHVSASNPAMKSSAAFMDIVTSDTVSSSASNSSRKKRSRGRKGLLRVSSRDSIPEHIAALSHSSFPSPAPSPMQLNRSASRLNNAATSMISDIGIDRDNFTTHQLQQQQQQLQQQRPKTASGYSNNTGSGPASSMSMHSSFTLHSSSATLTNHNMPPIATDLAHPLRGQPSADILGNSGPGFVPAALATGAFGRSDPTPHVPAQLTLVMQHASSISRKQFVRSLKDATTKYQSAGSSTAEPDSSLNDASLSNAGSDVLNFLPL
ncbi:hypothetical protein LPJ53_001451 [Coemansia erecta]|uniref:DH domain-containing protein n=1 Tax=Coemansia erecta TaxID=147472 RepID=A0A9W8CSV0_9FUNG|nr:hypothetical protein LPJ53_001451 [Coemansia erecta]